MGRPYKHNKLTAQLPPTPCTPDLRSRVVQAAAEQNISMSELTRRAFDFYLARLDRKLSPATAQHPEGV